ncbi:MAG: DUF3788 family protein [Oscillospiraceae bacterium]|nr:DUF3788 family protein [Oscillospiraceae bacterium]
MSVRYAKLEDLKETAKINVEGWRASYKGIIIDDYLNSLNYEAVLKRAEARFGNGLFFVYENKVGEILGFCWCGERKDVADEGFGEYDCELYAIYVRPDRIRQGIGKELFHFATKELKANGKSKMILWCLEENTPSIKFYKRMGGILLGTKAHTIGSKLYNESGFGYELSQCSADIVTIKQKGRSLVDRPVKPYEEVKAMLGGASSAWEKLTGQIRYHYMLDEKWDEGKPTHKHYNNLYFRRSGKAMITLCLREGHFLAGVVLGKDERAKFELERDSFSEAICKEYDDAEILHDGKWLGFDISDDSLIDDVFRLLQLKRKPNRKIVPENQEKCGRLDIGLSHEEITERLVG